MYIDDEIKVLFQKAVPANNNETKNVPAPRANRKFTSYFMIPFLISLFLYVISFVSDQIQSGILSFSQTHYFEDNGMRLITVKQSDEIKQIVAKIAEREKKHPNTIHNELKRLFKYNSYKTITHDNYMNIMPHLKERLE